MNKCLPKKAIALHILHIYCAYKDLWTTVLGSVRGTSRWPMIALFMLLLVTLFICDEWRGFLVHWFLLIPGSEQSKKLD